MALAAQVERGNLVMSLSCTRWRRSANRAPPQSRAPQATRPAPRHRSALPLPPETRRARRGYRRPRLPTAAPASLGLRRLRKYSAMASPALLGSSARNSAWTLPSRSVNPPAGSVVRGRRAVCGLVSAIDTPYRLACRRQRYTIRRALQPYRWLRTPSLWIRHRTLRSCAHRTSIRAP